MKKILPTESRYAMIYFLFVSALLFAACSSSKQLELTSLDQKPCRSEKQLTDKNEFTGETAENLTLFQQSDLVYASMDLRTHCNSKISFDVEKDGDRVKLKVKNNNTSTDDCVCISNVSTSVKNLAPGTYNFLITNSNGSQLLAQESVTVTEKK
jgi:hypothetical protein